MDVLEAAGGAVDEVFRFSVTENPPRDADLIPFHSQFLLTLGEGHGDLGHVVRGAGVGAAENDIGHFATTESFGRLLAEHPADSVQDIRLAATIRTDNRGHTPVKSQDRLGCKRLETDQFDGLKIHGFWCEMGGLKLGQSFSQLAKKHKH